MSKRILVLVSGSAIPPESIDGLSDAEIAPFKTEFDVVSGLTELGHRVRVMGADDDLAAVRRAVLDFAPHVVFNLLEDFGGRGEGVAYLLGYLELIRQSYTGCNPMGLMLSFDKALQRKVLRYHRIPSPDFVIFRRGSVVRRPRRLGFPLIVKALSLHGSVGIAQASIVHDDEKLEERVRFMYEHAEDDVIAEEFVPGRELYVGIIGNQRLEAFPVWELTITNRSEGAPLIATEKVKWDLRYQERSGVISGPARELPEGCEQRIVHMCKRAYRVLEQTGYARMDLRLRPDGRVFLIESNPNPQLSFGEDFAESAEAGGLTYPKLIGRIVSLGIRHRTTRA